jgi:hypothetical protein
MCDRRALVVVVAVCLAWESARAQTVRPIKAAGVGTDYGWNPNVGFDLRLQFRIKNAGNQPATITRSEVLMVFEGGWSYSQGETIANGKTFLGDSPTLAPGEERSYDWRGREDSPATHWLLAVQVSVAGRPAYDDMVAVPYHLPGFAAPPPVPAGGPLFIGLQEPIEVMALNSGQVFLPVVGKLTNLTGKPLTLTKWHFHVKDHSGKVALDRDASDLLKVEKSKETLSEFYHGFDLPKEFRKGTLRIEAEVEVDGKKLPLVREVPAESVEGYTVASPVAGPLWGWGGGPGCPGFSNHLHDIASRYSDDIGAFKTINGEKVTFSGDPNKNESFFGWDRPIHCVEDGRVVIVVDSAPDNFGWKKNEANVGLKNNCIFVEHAGGHRSCYYHMRQGSATVKVGQQVKAGQVLGRLGNAGSSGEPHLHFGYLAFDKHRGYHKNVPVRIKDLRTEDGKPVDGIVKDGFYLCIPAKPAQ